MKACLFQLYFNKWETNPNEHRIGSKIDLIIEVLTHCGLALPTARGM